MSPTLVQIIVLAVVQGAAELLPVSSSAHVIVAEKLMRLDPASPEMMFLMIMLHAGTMVAVIAYFWKSWGRSFFPNPAAAGRAILGIAAATAVTAAVALALKVLIERVVLGGRPGAAVEDLASNLPGGGGNGDRCRRPAFQDQGRRSGGSRRRGVPHADRPGALRGRGPGDLPPVPRPVALGGHDLDGDAARRPEAPL